MQPKLIISFDTLSEPQFLLRVSTIGTSLDGNLAFPGPWPAAVPAAGLIVTGVTTYQGAYKDAKDGDRVKIKVRKGQRVILSGQLKTVAGYLEIVAAGDVGMLATTGYELRHDIVKSTDQEPLAPLRGLKVIRGTLSGVLLVHAQADAFADVYDLQIAFADPAVEANWTDLGNYARCNRIELTGLTPQKTYYVRIRGFNKNGYGAWATSPGILVL
jgi:hypothetical protein